jgi:hypothetical protein
MTSFVRLTQRSGSKGTQRVSGVHVTQPKTSIHSALCALFLLLVAFPSNNVFVYAQADDSVSANLDDTPQPVDTTDLGGLGGLDINLDGLGGLDQLFQDLEGQLDDLLGGLGDSLGGLFGGGDSMNGSMSDIDLNNMTYWEDFLSQILASFGLGSSSSNGTLDLFQGFNLSQFFDAAVQCSNWTIMGAEGEKCGMSLLDGGILDQTNDLANLEAEICTDDCKKFYQEFQQQCPDLISIVQEGLGSLMGGNATVPDTICGVSLSGSAPVSSVVTPVPSPAPVAVIVPSPTPSPSPSPSPTPSPATDAPLIPAQVESSNGTILNVDQVPPSSSGLMSSVGQVIIGSVLSLCYLSW